MSSSNNDASQLYQVNERYEEIGDKNVWVEFTALARDYKAINLGQVSSVLFNSIYIIDDINYSYFDL